MITYENKVDLYGLYVYVKEGETLQTETSMNIKSGTVCVLTGGAPYDLIFKVISRGKNFGKSFMISPQVVEHLFTIKDIEYLEDIL